MRRFTLTGTVVLSVCIASLAARGAAGETEPPPGAIVGRTGGNERDCVLFARGRGAVALAVTYGEGDFRFDGLAPGEYMALSAGRVASRIPVRAGATTRLDFGEDACVAIPAETWSAARLRFGQTFVADASRIESISFWIPAGRHRLAIALANAGFEDANRADEEDGAPGWTVSGNLGAGATGATGGISPPEGARMFGYVHVPAAGEEIPRKIDPAERSLLLQEVAVVSGETYVLSALVLAREKDGGWQRNNRARLLALSAEPGVDEGAALRRLAADAALREARATQWYSTDGKWRRVRLKFRATGARAAVGVELYRWWALAEDAVFVDAVRLEPLRRGPIAELPREGEAARSARHARVAERRKGTPVLVHRGASRFAPENSLQAFNAAMDCGADGFEIDIRRSSDGVLYLLHDDTLDRTATCSGSARGLTYRELLACPLKGSEAKIPTLVSVLELARRRAALLHLDVKEPGLEDDIARLLDAGDMWDHLVEVNAGNAERIRASALTRLLRYKGWLPDDDAHVRGFLEREGEMVFVKEDPARALAALGRGAVEAVPLPADLEQDW